MTEKELKAFCGSLTLSGWRRKDGKIESPGSPLRSIVIEEWPEEVTIAGTTYVLDDVTQRGNKGDRGMFENAEYV